MAMSTKKESRILKWLISLLFFYLCRKLKFQLMLEALAQHLPFSKINSSATDVIKVLKQYRNRLKDAVVV
jgi:hypothetical protein